MRRRSTDGGWSSPSAPPPTTTRDDTPPNQRRAAAATPPSSPPRASLDGGERRASGGGVASNDGTSNNNNGHGAASASEKGRELARDAERVSKVVIAQVKQRGRDLGSKIKAAWKTTEREASALFVSPPSSPSPKSQQQQRSHRPRDGDDDEDGIGGARRDRDDASLRRRGGAAEKESGDDERERERDASRGGRAGSGSSRPAGGVQRAVAENLRRLARFPHRDESDPPEGYVNLWVNNFQRWQTRWLNASSTPGVLLVHRKSTKLGRATKIDLVGASVVFPSRSNQREFVVVAGDMLYKMRALRPGGREKWAAVIRDSASALERAAAIVKDRENERAAAAAARASEGGGGGGATATATAGAKKLGATRVDPPGGRPSRSSSSAPLDVHVAHSAPPVVRAAPPPSTPPPAADAATAEALRATLEKAWFEPTLAARAAAAECARDVKTGITRLAESLGVKVSGGEDDGSETAVTTALRGVEDAFTYALDAAIAKCVELETTNASLRRKLSRANEQLAIVAAECAPKNGVATTRGVGAPGDGGGRGDGAAAGVSQKSEDVVVVTPGRASAFARALALRDDERARGPEGPGGVDSSESDASSDYGSVASFISAAASLSFGGGGGGAGDERETPEYIAAVEVMNKHDYVVSEGTAADGERGDELVEGVASPTPGGGADAAASLIFVGGGGDDDDDDGGGDDDDDAAADDDAADDDDVDDDDAAMAAFIPRTRLPAPAPLNQSFSLWSVLRQAMGKDLNRISMPASINQPLSILQRAVEDFEYLQLLYDAIDYPAGVNRMAALCGFALSSYASWFARPRKPFAPTLGETYDWTSPDGRTRVLVEQLVYDPPVAAWHVEGTSPRGEPFVVSGDLAGVSKFWGQYLEVNFQGAAHLTLPRTNETYSWSKASMHVHGLVSGQIWIDMVGDVAVFAHATGEKAKLRLAKASGKGGSGKARRGRVEGEIFDADGRVAATVDGCVLSEVRVHADEAYERRAVAEEAAVAEAEAVAGGGAPQRRRTRLHPLDVKWRGTGEGGGDALPLFAFAGFADDAARQYGFTPFAIALNELTPEQYRNLPPTDSRLRPDMRALEDGDVELASEMKRRVEGINRSSAAARKAKDETYRPAWFARSESSGGGVHVNFAEHGAALWTYAGGYWEQREGGRWDRDATRGRDVFGLQRHLTTPTTRKSHAPRRSADGAPRIEASAEKKRDDDAEDEGEEKNAA